MTMKDVAEILAVLNKLQIESYQTLSPVEKELYKQLIDEIKRQVK